MARDPRRFDRNLVVIGAGSAGLVTAYIAAAVKAKVTLIERHRMGGDCLNTGCVPSKALIRSAKFWSQVSARARNSACTSADVQFDFAQVMERVQRVDPRRSSRTIRSSATPKLGVDCIDGDAKIVSPWAVEVDSRDGGTRTLTTRNIVIAAGARPFMPPIPGIEEIELR